MKVQKEKRRVVIVCGDNSVIKGTLHINPGERLSDFFNDNKESFIVITNLEFYNMRKVCSFKLCSPRHNKANTFILNKSFIKLIEEA